MKIHCRGLCVLLLLLTAFLLASADQDLHGGHNDPRCLTDYLYTVNCSLIIVPTEIPQDAYWLVFESDYKVTCAMSRAQTYHVCSFPPYEGDSYYDDDEVDMQTAFTDLDRFKISLCHNTSDGSQRCEVLDSSFTPAKNIMPNPSYNLTVTYSPNQYNFSWKSPYKLLPRLTYELQYYRQGQEKNVTTVKDIDKLNFSVADKHFVPDVEYAVKVRSGPTDPYGGQWSEWSTEIHWRTEPALLRYATIPDVFIPDIRIIIPMSVLGLLVFIFSYSFVKLRQNVFVPTPEPYFQSLYKDCQGDFKIWVATASKQTEVLETEETLPIDSLIKSAEDPEHCGTTAAGQEMGEPEGLPQHFASNRAYCTAIFVEMPPPYSVTSLPSPPASPPLSSESDSTVTGDSGCWLPSESPTERDTHWYTNEYCTLSDTMSSELQMACSVPAVCRGSAKNLVCIDYQNDFQ